MKILILNPQNVVFDGEGESIFVPGDKGEFEILPLHAPIVSILKTGNVIVDWKKVIPIKKGMVKFDGEECVMLVER